MVSSNNFFFFFFFNDVPGILLEEVNRPHREPGVHLVKQRGFYEGPPFIGASNSGAEVAENQR